MTLVRARKIFKELRKLLDVEDDHVSLVNVKSKTQLDQLIITTLQSVFSRLVHSSDKNTWGENSRLEVYFTAFQVSKYQIFGNFKQKDCNSENKVIAA